MVTTWLFRLGAAALATTLVILPACAAPRFRHVVIVIQENRTPDNIFGSNPQFEPGVDIARIGVNSHGVTIPLAPVPLDGCYDIAHNHGAFVSALTAGFDQERVTELPRCKLPQDPAFKFVDNSAGTVQPYFDIALAYGFANRMFQTNEGPSFPAHQFLFGGTSQPSVDSPLFAAENPKSKGAGCTHPEDRVPLINAQGQEGAMGPECFEHTTLTDLLDAAAPTVGWRYYAPSPGSIWTAPNAIKHICQAAGKTGQLTCEGPDWHNGNIEDSDPAKVLSDIAHCDLQGVNWVVPKADESDHATLNNGTGPDWVATIVNAVGTQAACPGGETYWDDTAIIITWDDWGGWFDHVKPFTINMQAGNAQWGDGYTYGFRVPMMVVSAYTPAGFVDNTNLDFGNILYFVETNFGLGFIGGRDMTTYGQYADYHAASRGDLAEFFSLTVPRSFQPIKTKLDARDFLAAPHSSRGPDDD